MTKNKKTKPFALTFKFSDFWAADYRIIAALLIALPLLVYAQVYNFDFLWDDAGHLAHPFLSDPSVQSFTQLSSEPFFGMYIPVTYFFWGSLKAFAEFLSLPVNSIFHLLNVLIHIANGLLVFTILSQFVKNKWAVLVGALFFLLHPIQVETVAWVSEFRGLLAFFFALLSLYFYMRDLCINKTNLPYASLFLLFLALMSKPSAAILPILIVTIHYFHYSFNLKTNLIKTLPFVGVTLIMTIVAFNEQSYSALHLDYWYRPFIWLDSMVFYLYQIIFPLQLSASYALSTELLITQWWLYPLAILPLILLILLWFKRQQFTSLAFASALFIIGFLPTSGLISFTFQTYSVVADRYIYFAFIGVALLVSTIFDYGNGKFWKGLMIGILLIFTTLTAFQQIPLWKNTAKLWAHSLKTEAVPSYATYNYGKTLAHAGEITQAVKMFNLVLDHHPKDRPYQTKHIDLFYNRGVAMLKLNKPQKALLDFEQVISMSAKNSSAYNLKIYTLIVLKQCKEAHSTVYFARKNRIQLPTETLKNLQKTCPS
ncbi:O-GlcNAc transferase [uncultured Candidatus Thioglobus sp.]|nr:O-GlcNAc transferase [uncultured Candidatus Thioglobus sp.]